MKMEVEQTTSAIVVNLLLRVPAWFIFQATLKEDGLFDGSSLMINIAQIAAYVISVVLLASSPSTLLKLYHQATAAILLIISGILCQLYITTDVDNFSFDSWNWIFSQGSTSERDLNIAWLTIHICLQCVLNSTIGYLLNLTYLQRFLLMAFCVPITADVIGIPPKDLFTIYVFANRFVTVLALIYLVYQIRQILTLLQTDAELWFTGFRVFGMLRTIATYWQGYQMSAQVALFWIVQYICCVVKYFVLEPHPDYQEQWSTVAFWCVGEVCDTQLSIIACCFTVSYISKLLITLIKIMILNDRVGMHDDVATSGLAEGIMMFFISFQLDLLELKPMERAVSLSVIIFLVVTTLLQSIYEITEPHLLSLSASLNRNNAWAHIKAVSLCTFLLCVPLTMCYYIIQFLDSGALAIIITASFAVTSIQVLGTLVVYTLFILDSFQETSWQGLDDAVYFTRATTRCIDFAVAVFVVGFGFYETAFGERNWLNLVCLLLHLYFGIWLRLQEGWRSFLLRRNAVKKVQSLPQASPDQLEDFNDMCAICHQDMVNARITHCNHYFHDVCLRKWLYVQDSCPLCHQSITPPERAPPDELPNHHQIHTPHLPDVHPPNERGPESLHDISEKLDEAIQNLTRVIQEMEEAKRLRQHILETQQDAGENLTPEGSQMDVETRSKLMECAQTLTRMAEDGSSREQSPGDNDLETGPHSNVGER